MKLYEIIDDETDIAVAVLLYYEKRKEFIIELQEDLDEWTAPLLFTNLVKKGIYTVPRDLSFRWVKERVIPSGRQNISEILKNHKMETYEEMEFLKVSKGKCSQDSFYIKPLETLPDYVIQRRKNVIDCVPCQGKRILCFFEDGTVKKIDLHQMEDVDGVAKVLRNDSLYHSCEVGTGGYFITFYDTIDIPAKLLYERGQTIPLRLDDFLCFAKGNLLDTSDCCEVLECSRQNVSYLVKKEQLLAVKEDVKGNLYLKGNVVRNSW